MKKLVSVAIAMLLTFTLAVTALAETVEASGSGPADVSKVASVNDVPLLTLNNGVQVPQLGLGTQIQRLESDASQVGRALLNQTSHDAVLAALQAGYRHLDTAHGYYNERGVGEAIRDSSVPREEIWVTSKLWPSEYGEGKTLAAIDALERLGLTLTASISIIPGIMSCMEGSGRPTSRARFAPWAPATLTTGGSLLGVDEMEIKPQILQIECHPFAQRKET